MSYTTVQTYDHALELGPGTAGVIHFRFPKDRRTTLQVRLAAADRASGMVELVLDNLWRGYEIMRCVEGADDVPWSPVLTVADGEVHVVLDLRAGERVNIESDDQFVHSIRLAHASWNGDILALTFRESA
jgi:hypothetical protein